MLNKKGIDSEFLIMGKIMKSLLRLVFFTWLVAGILACSNTPQTQNKAGLRFNLPEGWDVIEDTALTDNRRKVIIMSSDGTSTTLELFTGDLAKQIDSRIYLKEYMIALFPEQETRSKANFDLSETARKGIGGHTINVRLGEPYNTDFVMELYEIVKKKKDKVLYVVFNSPPNLTVNSQMRIDAFIGSLSI